MAAIDGIIILDPAGRAIISSHFRAQPQSYPLLHIDAFNAALAKSRSLEGTESTSSHSGTLSNDLDPIIWVNAPMGGEAEGGWGSAALCHVEREGLRFLIPISQEVNPMLAFAFLDAFLDTLTIYLGDVTETTLRDNFDTVYMLIEEMIDEGHPMTMETNMLKDIVLPPTLVRKLLNAAGVSALHSQNSNPFATAIPWRRPASRYSNNEIYFDIEESINAIVDRHGNVRSMEVWGRIGCNARLSGTPDLILTFSNPKLMENCAFHPCIRYKKWNKDHVLSFIPPDGSFKLLEYQVAKPSENGVARPVGLPLTVKPVIKLEKKGGKFILTVKPRINARPIENIVLTLYLGEGTTSVSATATGEKRGPATSGSGAAGRGDDATGGVGGGSWEFDPNTKLLKWTISSMVMSEKPASLTGSFTSTLEQPIPSPCIQVGFEINQHSLSGLRVDQLKVLNDAQGKPPFRGIRTFVKTGSYEVRW